MNDVEEKTSTHQLNGSETFFFKKKIILQFMRMSLILMCLSYCDDDVYSVSLIREKVYEPQSGIYTTQKTYTTLHTLRFFFSASEN